MSRVRAVTSVRVEVVDEERIVQRGVSRVAWFARINDGWLLASAWPGAVVERLDAPAGTVWAHRVELSAPIGTRFMRVETRPSGKRRAPLDYLLHGSLGARQSSTKSYYRLDGSGRLLADARRRG
jgi:hypothetical protein